MYFKEFPAFLYDFKYEDGTTKTEVVKDITRNIRVKKEILSNITLYDYYDLTDGDTPEIIAEKFYGNPEYHWIVMLTNDKIDWLADFPLTETEITKHIEHTYNPTLNSKEWWFKTQPDPVDGLRVGLVRARGHLDVAIEVVHHRRVELLLAREDPAEQTTSRGGQP